MAVATQQTVIDRRGSHPWARAAGTSGTAWSAWHRREATAARPARVELTGVPGQRSAKAARLEAALFVADGPLTSRKLAQFALLADAAEVRAAIEELNAAYDVVGTPFRIERVATGYQLLTLPAYANWLDKLHERQAELKLSAPAMETLTMIAYRQPITRADIEAVRGVQCAEIIKLLMERGLVKIGGEDDSLGRPYLYVTTRKFLELFGLRSLDDLPMSDLRRETQAEADEEEPELLDDEDDLDDDTDDEEE